MFYNFPNITHLELSYGLSSWDRVEEVMASPVEEKMLDMEQDYDEEADSDFNNEADDDLLLTSSDEDNANDSSEKSQKKRKPREHVSPQNAVLELDSGDEATIKEQQKARRKSKRKGEHVDGDSGNESEEWRARTRAMRIHEQDQRKRNKLASSRGSTIDVDKLWEAMNRPGPLPPVRMEDGNGHLMVDTQSEKPALDVEHNKENIPDVHAEEMITIKRKFHFAGEIHEEEKLVPKSSAEARLWLAQQAGKVDAQIETQKQPLVQRPIRKVSRFDPNLNNLAAFRTNFSHQLTPDQPFKGPRLNVVEKSKMDWAAHVDAEGLKDELDIHAKAKEGYHSRMDFLNQVELRKEEEARLARTKT